MKKIPFTSAVIGLLMFTVFSISCSFGPGSYPNAEIYEFDMPQKDLIDKIQKFKSENPNLKLPKEINDILSEGYSKNDNRNFWYHIYFYYPDKNEIVKTWVRSHGKTKATFAFVAINKGLKLGNWKLVNEDFFWWNNEPMKEEFEERILKKIK